MNYKILCYIILILLLLSIIYIQFNKYKINKTPIIKTLVRQASRWSTAASQDKNQLIALLHANYGAAYLWALKDIATDKEIERAMNIDIIKFRDEIIDIQDKANLAMIKVCQNIAPEQTYLSKLAKEGV